MRSIEAHKRSEEAMRRGFYRRTMNSGRLFYTENGTLKYTRDKADKNTMNFQGRVAGINEVDYRALIAILMRSLLHRPRTRVHHILHAVLLPIWPLQSMPCESFPTLPHRVNVHLTPKTPVDYDQAFTILGLIFIFISLEVEKRMVI